MWRSTDDEKWTVANFVTDASHVAARLLETSKDNYELALDELVVIIIHMFSYYMAFVPKSDIKAGLFLKPSFLNYTFIVHLVQNIEEFVIEGPPGCEQDESDSNVAIYAMKEGKKTSIIHFTCDYILLLVV